MMEEKTIILADNHVRSLKIWAELLRSEGYRVNLAGSFSAAEKLLEQKKGDLAVLDLHLKRDEDEHDLSGLELAEAHGRSVPAIIFTGGSIVEVAKRVMASGSAGRPSIIGKADGPMALFKEIRRMLLPKIFLAHGLDEEARRAVVKFLERGELPVVVLQESPGGAKVIIEKLEEYTDVKFAIVLMTPDDLGRRRSKREKLRPRARQNVVFELGYLMAKLGRQRVLALHKHEFGEIELPSNCNGVQLLEMDSRGDWKARLAIELRRALAQP